MLPRQGSTIAGPMDDLYMFIFWLSVVFFIIIAGQVVWFGMKYRRRGPGEKTPHITHHLNLELAWSIIPLLLCIVLFFWGFDGYMKATVVPGDAMEIQVRAKRWQWEFEYPDGIRALNDLYIPVNKKIRMVMISDDVLHSFWVPEFRVKMDVLPNRYTDVWFESTIPGTYNLTCTEYCGKGHSTMRGSIKVLTPVEYEDFVKEGPPELKNMPLRELGELVYKSRGCESCHSLDGSRRDGPSWKGIFGKTEKFTDGTSAVVDENYIRDSLMNPHSKIVATYEAVMPVYKGLLRDREVLGVIEYIKSLK